MALQPLRIRTGILNRYAVLCLNGETEKGSAEIGRGPTLGALPLLFCTSGSGGGNAGSSKEIVE